MTKRVNTGAIKVCTRNNCGDIAVRLCGCQWLCAKHFRFTRMRIGAKINGKTVPSHDELEAMVNPDNKCADCDREMNWFARDGASTVACLQHYRDGSFGIVCLSCNTRHGHMSGDSFRDMPKDHKLCPSCKEIKPGIEFCTDNGRTGELRRKSNCRACCGIAALAWAQKNRDRVNSNQRKYRAFRIASGNPIKRKSKKNGVA